MKLERRKTRELAVQIMFQVEVGHLPLDEVLATAKEEMPEDAKDWGSVSPEEWEYISQSARGVGEHSAELDAIIARLAEGWSLERIANVDRIALRLALYEMLYRETPAPIVINAAVDIVKKYSTEDSGRFVNGILGAFLRERRAAPGEAPGAPVLDGESDGERESG